MRFKKHNKTKNKNIAGPRQLSSCYIVCLTCNPPLIIRHTHSLTHWATLAVCIAQ